VAAVNRSIALCVLLTGLPAALWSVAGWTQMAAPSAAADLSAAYPYLSLVPHGSRLDVGQTFAPGLKLRQATSGGEHRAGAHDATPIVRTTYTELSTAWGQAVFGVAVGHQQQETMSAAQRPGSGFVVRDTAALALSGTYRFAESWGIAGRYAASYMDGSARSAEGVGQRLGSSRSDIVSLGLTKSETLFRGDRLSLSLGQSFRSSSMRAGDGPFALADHEAATRFEQFGFRPSVREVITELNYFTPINKRSGLGLSLMNRNRPNQDPGVPDERVMSIRFSTQF
jgi:hypothetical protein